MCILPFTSFLCILQFAWVLRSELTFNTEEQEEETCRINTIHTISLCVLHFDSKAGDKCCKHLCVSLPSEVAMVILQAYALLGETQVKCTSQTSAATSRLYNSGLIKKKILGLLYYCTFTLYSVMFISEMLNAKLC